MSESPRRLTILEQLRRERGWTQHDITAFTGINQLYISLLERNQFVPTVEQWTRLAAVFGVSVDTLRQSCGLPQEVNATISEVGRG